MTFMLKNFKYYVLSKITIGKKRKYYKEKYQRFSITNNFNSLHTRLNELEDWLNNTEYEICDKFNLKSEDVKIPNILSMEDTVNEIINNKKSVCRFGDGEFITLIGKSDEEYYKQKRNFILQKKLRETLTSKDENILVCLWDYWGNLDKYNDFHKKIARMHLHNIREDIYKYLDFKKIYGNAFLSRPYIIYKDRSNSKMYFNQLKKIWDLQDIVIIEGKYSRLGVGNNLFDNASSIERIICPAEASFDNYDEIFNYVTKNISKNKLILIALGMTATVLAHDLAKLGFWAIDIGHVDIEYEWFLQKCDKPSKVKNKYVNEAGQTQLEEINDNKYLQSIIKEIKKKNYIITNNDIEIFVLTYNRCEYLKESLQSILNQSVKDITITIIDNASTDGTQEYVEQLCNNNPYIKYVRNEQNMGSEYSYNLAAELADKTYMMCFHDDDLLHPRYIETALKYLNMFDNVNILSTDCHTPKNINNENWEDVSTNAIYCKDYKELASYMYYEGNFAYPPVIYRTENAKKLNFNKEPYGKIDDKPRCVETCRGGSAIILQDKHFLRYRVHPKQDSSDCANGPFYHEIINFNKYFKDILFKKIYQQDYWLFLIRNVEWFEFCYYWGNDYSLSLEQLIKKGLENDAACYFTRLQYKKHYKTICRKIKRFLRNNVKPIRKIVSCDEYKLNLNSQNSLPASNTGGGGLLSALNYCYNPAYLLGGLQYA